MDVGQQFRDSEEYEILEPYADSNGLFAGYRIEGLLSRHPQRYTIYEASTPAGKRVALKLLRPRSGVGPLEAMRFRRRVRARASIEHPHLLPIFGSGWLDEHLYVAMGLCRAPTLADLLGGGLLTTTACLRLLGQLADALETAHGRGVIHRELAPENVFVKSADGGHVLLGDFGVANPSGLIARPHYVSPEELRNEPLTSASNVHSLACILVECLTGSPPYTSALPGSVAYAHAVQSSDRQPDLPVAIDDLMAAAMATDPGERPESPRRLVAAVVASLGLDHPPPEPLSASLEPGRDGSPATAAPADGSPPARTAESSELPAGRSVLHRRVGASRALLSRHGVVLALAVLVAVSGLLGFTLSRPGDGGSQASRAPSVDPAPLQAQREATAALRGTGVALENLGTRRASARRRLATARTSRAQAAAAGRLASSYAAAGRAIPSELPDTARAASVLMDAGRAYGQLASAARRGRRGGYLEASRAVRRSERKVQQVVVRLNQSRR